VGHFDRVEWQIIPDFATAAAALQAGETDWWEQPTGDFLPMLRRNRNLTVEVADVLGLIGIIRPNHLTEPFNNPAVRRAVITAINQVDIMTPVIGERDLIRDKVGFFAPASPLASDVGLDRLQNSSTPPGRELQAAGAMGARLVLMNATDLASINASTLVVADLFRRMGLNVDYQALDWGTVLTRRASRNPLDQGGWSAFCTFWSAFDHWTPAGHNAIRGNGTDAWPGWPTIPELEAKRDEWFDAPEPRSREGRHPRHAAHRLRHRALHARPASTSSPPPTAATSPACSRARRSSPTSDALDALPTKSLRDFVGAPSWC
jgi:peptide/nickel transport system substrate-binding protein